DGATDTDSTVPPSKPRSSRTRSSLAGTAHQLREDAVGGVGVEESDLEPVQAPARLAVDQLDALAVQCLELRLEVVDLVGDVVHTRSAAGEEAADGRVVRRRREQLDPALADEDGRRLDALLGDRVAVLEPGAEQPAVGGDRLVEVGDRDGEVVDALDGHRLDAIRPGCRAARGPPHELALEHLPAWRRSSRSGAAGREAACGRPASPPSVR